MRANAGEADENEEPLPETHIEARYGEAEGLELEAEFGATEHTPTRAGANERTWERGVGANAGGEVGTDKGRPGRNTTNGKKGDDEAREGRDCRRGQCENYEKYDNKVWEPQAPDSDAAGTTGGGAERDTTKPGRDREADAWGLGIGVRVHRTRSHEYEGVGDADGRIRIR